MSGRSRKGREKAAEGQGKAEKRQRKVKERQRKGSGRSRNGREKAAEGQGTAEKRQHVLTLWYRNVSSCFAAAGVGAMAAITSRMIRSVRSREACSVCAAASQGEGPVFNEEKKL